MKHFKVLFIYPNLSMSSMIPHGIAVLSAVLKKHGFETAVFDTTFYHQGTQDANAEKVRVHNVLPYSFAERGINPVETDVYADLRAKVKSFDPDLIAISFVEDSFKFGVKLLQSIRMDTQARIVAGGVFCTHASHLVFDNSPEVDYIILGDGETAMLYLCFCLAAGARVEHIDNLVYRDAGYKNYHYNNLRQPEDINDLPCPDYSIFPEQNLYRPMMGKVWRMVGIETNRGCPFTCGYCNSAANSEYYRLSRKRPFFRKRMISVVAKELETMVNKYKPEFIYFISDVFLMMTDAEFDEFCKVYEQYKIPFFMNTRAETVTQDRVDRLKSINCRRVNIGIEHGNEKFRREIIGRKVSDDALVTAISMMGRSGISTVANNIIGFPNETRELVFDTIRLNRKVEFFCDSINCTIFAPYHGTRLRHEAEMEHYIRHEEIVDTACSGSMLRMPSMTSGNMQGLLRTFTMYVRLPVSEWDRIKVAEQMDDEGNAMYAQLSKELDELLAERQVKT
ncbi:MAG: radical SAM protein [Spirochaetes bacterium]|jgi:radical SAM superfamily enzyme YgiQ (UPF0313 family)|nr:radical SAM protein [Spirochaetota bacterium]